MPSCPRRALIVLVLPLAVLARPAAPQAPAPGAEPTVLKPGDPAVSGSFIQPCTNRWSVTKIGPDGKTQPVGSWTDEVKIEQRNGLTVIRRTQVATLGGGETRYVNVVDQKTMAPVSSEQSNAKGLVESCQFDGLHVRRKHAAGSGPASASGSSGSPAPGTIEEKDFQLAMPTFQFGGMYGMLLVAFPLRAGAVLRFPNFDGQKGGLEWLVFHVTGKEPVPAGPGKTVDAWIVESEPQNGVKLRFSLVKEAPYIIRLDQVKSDTKGDTIVRWDMI